MRLTVTLTAHLINLTNPTITRPIPCPCRVPGTHRKICNRKVMKDFTTFLLIISSIQMITFSTQMCCKGALRLCHCKEKNDCQSAANIIDTAFNIFKARDNKVKEGDKEEATKEEEAFFAGMLLAKVEEGGKWDAAKAKGGEWKNAAKDMFKGKEDNKAREEKKAN